MAELLRIGIESAGASRGFVVSERADGLFIDAEADVDGARASQRALEEQRERLFSTVVHYVASTGEPVVVGDAARDPRFARDVRAQSASASSVLCMPIMHRGSVQGILYLENELATDAFTAERSKVIELLAAQAGVSLENAKLFDAATREAEQRRIAAERLQAALHEVESLKNRLHAENVYLQE